MSVDPFNFPHQEIFPRPLTDAKCRSHVIDHAVSTALSLHERLQQTGY